jgi:hypothetical protein
VVNQEVERRDCTGRSGTTPTYEGGILNAERLRSKVGNKGFLDLPRPWGLNWGLKE